MNEIVPAVEAWLRENERTLPGVTRRDGTWEVAPAPGRAARLAAALRRLLARRRPERDHILEDY